MSHSHAHSHGSDAAGNYVYDQVCTVALAGALGLSAILMYRDGTLTSLLIPQFHLPVLIAGAVITLMALVRFTALWRTSGVADRGEEECCAEPQKVAAFGVVSLNMVEPRAEHSHSHAEHDEHEHAWAPWRYVVLMAPVLLYVLGQPQNGINEKRLGAEFGGTVELSSPRLSLASVGGGPALAMFRSTQRASLGFGELAAISNRPKTRDAYDGATVALRGQLFILGNGEITLFRTKMNCCAADAVNLRARILTPSAIVGMNNGDWVQIVGELGFGKVKNEWLPVVRVQSNTEITPIEPIQDANDGI